MRLEIVHGRRPHRRLQEPTQRKISAVKRGQPALLLSVQLASMKALTAACLIVLALCISGSLALDRTLALALKQRNVELLERTFWERTDPSHPDYAKYACLTN